jgi:hypothetical protein
MAARKKTVQRAKRAKAKRRTPRVTQSRAVAKVRAILQKKRRQGTPSARRSSLAREDHTPLSQHELDQGNAASREAEGREARAMAKRRIRNQRAQRGEPGARSREARNAEH